MDKPHAPGAVALHPPPQGRICLRLGRLGGPLPCLWCSAPHPGSPDPHAHPHPARLGCTGSLWLCPHSHCFPPARAPTLLHNTGGGT